MLEYLMRHAGRVMSRTLITEYAWDYHFDPGTNIVDVVINRLRKKVDSAHAAEAGPHRARRGLRREARDDHHPPAAHLLVHGGAGRDRARVRDPAVPRAAVSPACGSWTSGCCSRPIWRSAGSASRYNVLGRIVTTAGGRSRRSTRASAPISTRSATTSIVADTGGPGARALGRDPRAGRGRPPGARPPMLDTLRTGRIASGTVDLGPPSATARYLAHAGSEDAGPEVGGVLVAASLERCRVRPHRAAPLHAAHRPGDPRGRRCWSATGSPGPVSGRCEGIMDEVEAITDGRSLHRRARSAPSPATRWRGSRSR